MRTFEKDVELAVAYHGHLCSGQCIGVKMAHYAYELLGLDNETDQKKIIVFLECDRCPADAIGVVTGCKVGKRTYKMRDYGKTAATFINLSTNRAVRIYRYKHVHPADDEDMVAFYKQLPYEDMLRATNVEVPLEAGDMPGKPVAVATCALCGEEVTDNKHVERIGGTLCQTCAYGTYYKNL